ncbi:MAG TPA: hypothetical protein VE593_01700 [Nitrososphaeraceae archaeon]|nr:hypothetical protein [Nitrososphaeraceae archaeon]
MSFHNGQNSMLFGGTKVSFRVNPGLPNSKTGIPPFHVGHARLTMT